MTEQGRVELWWAGGNGVTVARRRVGCRIAGPGRNINVSKAAVTRCRHWGRRESSCPITGSGT